MRAIVVNSTRYGDDSFIVTLYTEEGGTTTVSVKTAAKGRVRMSHIQPLNLVEVTLTGKPSQNIKQIRECSVIWSPTLSGDITKVLSSQFLAEWLSSILRSYSHEDRHLFGFLFRSIEYFANAEKGVGNFHLFFLIKLTLYLGIFPNTEQWAEGRQFDMIDAQFVEHSPTHGYFLTESDSINFVNMLRTSYGTMHLWQMTRAERNRTLDYIIRYYHLHSIEVGRLRSLDILREI